jgi:hypothetical protein
MENSRDKLVGNLHMRIAKYITVASAILTNMNSNVKQLLLILKKKMLSYLIKKRSYQMGLTKKLFESSKIKS